MQLAAILSTINLFFAGTLAGIEIASHYGLITGDAFLAENARIQLRQALVRRLRVLVPVFFVPAFISTIAIIAVDGVGHGSALKCFALLAYAFWIYARVIATVHINSATVDWNPSSPPVGWQHLVSHAERFHVASLWVVTIGFACLLVAR